MKLIAFFFFLILKAKMEQFIIPCLLNLVNENNDEINIECISVCIS